MQQQQHLLLQARGKQGIVAHQSSWVLGADEAMSGLLGLVAHLARLVLVGHLGPRG